MSTKTRTTTTTTTTTEREYHGRIHREAREAAEDAITALRELCEQDPFVYHALLEVLFCGLATRGGMPMSTRHVLDEVRRRAWASKGKAMERWCEEHDRKLEREAAARSTEVH
jgi:hypothetical protein